MHTNLTKLAFWLLVPVFLFACASKTELRKEVDGLSERIRELEAKYLVAASRFEEVERISQMSFAIQDRLESIDVEQAKQRKYLAKLAQGGRAVSAQQYATPRNEPQTVAIQAPPAATAAPKPKKKVAKPEMQGESVQDLYSKAYKLLQDGAYQRARPVFGHILETWPKDDLADNSLYWLAEMHYAEKDYIEALKHFEAVVEKYPAGNKVPDALLKQSFSWAKLGDSLKANQVADILIKKYPWTPAAEKAQEAKANGVY